MNDRFEHIDNVFQEGLGDFKAKPNESAWENIARRLQENKRKRKIVFLSRAAAIFAFAVTLISGYYLSQNIISDNEEIITENNPTNEQSDAKPDNTQSNKSFAATEDVRKEAPAKTETKASSTGLPDNNHQLQEKMVSSTQLAEKSMDEVTKDNVMLTNSIATVSENNRESNALTIDKAHNKDAYLENSERKHLPIFNSSQNNVAAESSTSERSLTESYLDEYAMEEIERNNNKLKFQLSGVATPLYASVESQNDINPQARQFFSDNNSEPEVNEDALTAYTAGLKFSVSKGRRFSVQAGVMYAKVDQMHQYEAIEQITVSNESIVQNNSDRIIDNDAPAAPPLFESAFEAPQEENEADAPATQFNQYVQTISDDVEYLEIPLSMRYKIVDRKLDVNLLGGMATNFLISGERKTATGSGVENTTDITVGLDKVKYSTHLGIGFEYPIYKELVFVLEPTLKYYMNSLETINQTSVNPFAFGLYTGVNFAF